MIKFILTLSMLMLFTPALYSQEDNGALTEYIQNLPMEDLSESEISGLELMREEEKLARDVYLALHDVWGTNIFKNIAKSEQTHMDWVGVIIEKYELNDPMLAEPGVFTSQHLQELYNALIASGSESKANALFVGCTIEDLDIYDLLELLKVTDNEDIRVVYQNLLMGSRNHMRSFERLYSREGETYTVQFITEQELAAILDSDMEQGPLDAEGNRLDLTSVEDDALISVNSGSLQTYPNPFSSATTISYQLNNSAAVVINIYNNSGEKIRTLTDEVQAAGQYNLLFEAGDIAPGIYHYSIQTGSQILSNKMILVK